MSSRGSKSAISLSLSETQHYTVCQLHGQKALTVLRERESEGAASHGLPLESDQAYRAAYTVMELPGSSLLKGLVWRDVCMQNFQASGFC